MKQHTGLTVSVDDFSLSQIYCIVIAVYVNKLQYRNAKEI